MLYLDTLRLTRKKSKLRGFLILSLALLLLLAVLLNARLTPLVSKFGLEKVRSLSIAAVDEALLRTFNNTQELFTIHRDAIGQITFLACDTEAVNRLRALLAETINSALQSKEETTFSIPLGNLFSAPLLAGKGPSVTAHLTPLSSALVTLTDSFREAGINQTLFTLSCNVEVRVRLICPLAQNSETFSLSCPIAQILLPGSVPDVYVKQ